MNKIQSIHLQRLQGQLGDVVYQLTKVQFNRWRKTDAWRPAINAYRCADNFIICVDLAGVDRERLELQVEPRRLVLRGVRHAPEPSPEKHKALQILAMEIDYGPFEREVIMPCDVDPERVQAEQRNGLLWIHLPYQCHG